MTMSQLPDAAYWRARADEALTQASQMANLEARRILLALAENFEQLEQLATSAALRRGRSEARGDEPRVARGGG
jgi:hypothetical protein